MKVITEVEYLLSDCIDNLVIMKTRFPHVSIKWEKARESKETSKVFYLSKWVKYVAIL